MHVHRHSGSEHTRTLLALSGLATLAYVIVAFLVGLRAHSLALVSEAGHNLTDFLALALAWLAVYLESKPPTPSKTFGYHRAGVLAALVNVASLAAITVLIVVEAIGRVRAPGAVATTPMFWVACAGLAMNLTIAALLPHGHADVNLRAAFLHMAGDALATGLVLVGALVIAHTGWTIVDPLLSFAIAALIVASGWSVLRDVLNILLEAAPAGIGTREVTGALAGIEGVLAVHDLHIWSLGSCAHALSAHIQIADIPPSESQAILERVQKLLAERFAVCHSTIQFESLLCDESGRCRMGMPGAQLHVHERERLHQS